MGQAQSAKSDGLRSAYLALERSCHQQRECLLRVINTFGLLVDRSPKFCGTYREIKRLLKNDAALPLDDIHNVTQAMRSRIFAEEMKDGDSCRETATDSGHHQTLGEAYKVLNKIVLALTDGFYPIADTDPTGGPLIRLDFRQGMALAEFQKAAERLFTFVEEMKRKISEDFKANNNTFLNFYNQVRDLERVLTRELSEESGTQSFDAFEQEINQDVGTIVNSFDTYTTLNEVKTAVVDRLAHIKRVLADRKKAEQAKAVENQKKILWLREKIAQAESEVRKLSMKAEHYQEEANKDGLSGLYNRKAFDKRIADALRTFHNGGSEFLLVMFDVDNFKWINDTYGHVAGDKILQEVASVLTKTFRKDEFIARYGGDEFAVVIEGLTENTARKRIASFMKTFSRLRFFSHKGGDIDISISAGMATVAQGDAPEDIIHKADLAMYEVKKQHKDQKRSVAS